MRASVQQWGNSLALRIPKGLAQDSGLRRGAEVDLSVSDGRLIAKAVRRRHYTLRQLLAGVTARNRHPEDKASRRTGREVW